MCDNLTKKTASKSKEKGIPLMTEIATEIHVC